MFRAFDVAASGLRQHQLYLDVTGNNVANVNSDGFKAGKAEFEDTLNQLVRGTGITPQPQPNGARNAAMVGLGVARRGVEGDFAQGAFRATNNPTDLGIQGGGYFVLRGPQGPVYTRNGAFTIDASGTLVAGDGKKVLGTNDQPIKVPQGVHSMTIGGAGQVVGTDANGRPVQIGQVKLARFENDRGLLRTGNTEFQQTAASGAPVQGAPGTNGLGEVISGVMEASNVDLGNEFANLIQAQRGYSMNSKVMTTADELADRINQMK